MSVSSRSGALGLEKLPCSKYKVRKLENGLTLQLSAAEIHNFCSKTIKDNLLIQNPRNDLHIFCW